MLLNFNDQKPLYVLGTGVNSQQLKNYIVEETSQEVICVDHNEFDSIASGSQCIAGFINHRQKNVSLLYDQTINWVTYISKFAYVDSSATVSPGCVIMPMAMIDYQVTLGFNCIVCPYSLIGHSTTVGNNVIICPKSNIGGSSTIGDNFYLGPGSQIMDRLTITHNVTCVINSFVTKNIDLPGRYYGNQKMSEGE
jgi:UDP-3-O-[3-hydroxymyristoyl] glucosamine N-acyltransferase